MWWWVGCAVEPQVVAVVRPSRFVEAALVVEWAGPEGHGEVQLQRPPSEEWVPVGAVDGASGAVPLGLLAAGAWRWRVVVDDGARVYPSPPADLVAPSPPPELGRRSIESEAGAETPEGWVITHRYAKKPYPEEGFAVVLDGLGDPVWWTPRRSGGDRVVRALPGRDGRSILVLVDNEDPLARRIERWSVDGESLVTTLAPEATHDFRENGDGTFTYLAYVYGPPFPGTTATVAADAVARVPEGATSSEEVELLWSFFEDYGIEPWRPCSHADPGGFLDDYAEWTHTNSLIRAPADDGWVLLPRHLDALVEIGDDGAFRWQAGGRDSTLLVGEGAAFEHGHASQAWGDRVLVFDNGGHSPEPVSRVVELAVDPVAGTVAQVWELVDPLGSYVGFLGDAQRLPGGNTLVTWSNRGEIVEYTPDGEAVWRFSADVSYGRAVWVPSLTP